VCNALIDGEAPFEVDLTQLNTAAAEVRVGAPYLEGTELVERWRTDAPVRLALGRLAADAIRLIARLPTRHCRLVSRQPRADQS
jgi:hypothetical protein